MCVRHSRSACLYDFLRYFDQEYFNGRRPHQGINGKTPTKVIQVVQTINSINLRSKDSTFGELMAKKQQIRWYDELREQNGAIRSHYQEIYQHWQSLPQNQVDALFDKSKKLFSGDYKLDPLPRLLTPAEFAHIRSGVLQRAKAIRAFLVNYYERGRKWRQVVDSRILHDIMERNHPTPMLGRINPRHLAFPYGPDIIRDCHGRWRIVEDSAGCLGGIGDLTISRNITLKLNPYYRELLHSSADPDEYFVELAKHYHQMAKRFNGIPYLYLPEIRHECDHETRRLGKIFQSLGIEFFASGGRNAQFYFEKNGIYVKKTGKKKQRVGYLILYASPRHTEPPSTSKLIQHFNSVRPKLSNHGSFDIAQELNRYFSFNPLKESLLQGHAGTNFSPGTQFINDKRFGLYVDFIIQHFLRETPILESIPSQPIGFVDRNGTWRADHRALQQIKRQKDDFVIKRVDEDGGGGVFIGQKHTRSSFAKIVNEVQYDPSRYIFQKFEHLSVLDNRIVDLRLHTHVDCEKIILSNTPWGRANWLDGDGKVNLSTNGFTSPVVVLH